jgi:eukaryotic-like serine/threonine-protein kinase
VSPSPPPSGSDRNLLFGVLALQLDFVNRDDLIVGMNAWALDKAKPLGQILCDQGVLAAARRALLESLVDEHVQQHDGDVAVSLEAVSTPSTVSDFLDALRNPDELSTLSDVQDPPRSVASPDRGGTRFRNLRFHAKGGLGQVFRADDTELNREVALKEIQPRRADDPGSRARFVREAEITGALEHPGIIPVYGLGAYPDGKPYYAMRFIRGESLKAAIDRYHAGPTSLELRRLIRRLIDVCNAVGYAHSRGVVHRDLKPENVMLGPFGETLVVDWGLAKAGIDRPAGDPNTDATTDPTIHPPSGGKLISTLEGFALGTPGYMSPEQANGLHATVGPASDVFGLGAILYCLLTAHKPFEGTTVEDEITQTKKGLYSPPRTVNAATPPALDAVCRKALAHEPAERYPSALALAIDLERWLADEPVAVYRDPLPVRAARWGRRHRTAVAGVAVLLVTAVVASGIGMGLIWKEQQKTAAKKQEAEENFGLARDLTAGFELLAANEAEFAASPAKHKARKAMLVAAAKASHKLVDRQPDDADVRRQAARVYRFTANVHRLEREHAAAEALYRDAVDLLAGLQKQFPDELEYQLQLSETLRDSAKVQSRLGHLAEAVQTLDRVIGLADAVLTQSPDDPWTKRVRALGLLSRSTAQYARGKYMEANADAQEAGRVLDLLAEKPVDAHPYDPILRSAATNVRALAERETGQLDKAAEFHREAIKLADPLVKKAPAGVNAVDAEHFQMMFRLEQARTWVRTAEREDAKIGLSLLVGAWTEVRRKAALLANAEKNFGALAGRWQQLAKDHPENPDYRQMSGVANYERGRIRQASGRVDDARIDLEMAREILEAEVARSPDVPDLRGDLGRVYARLARLARATGDKVATDEWFSKAIATLKLAVEQAPERVRDRRDLTEIDAQRPR